MATTTIQAVVDEKLKKELLAVAKRENRSLSNVVESLLIQSLAARQSQQAAV